MLPALPASQDFSEIIYVEAQDLFSQASLVLFTGHPINTEKLYCSPCFVFYSPKHAKQVCNSSFQMHS